MAARRGLALVLGWFLDGSWMTFYHEERPRQAMDYQMPMAVWRAGMEKIEAQTRTVDMPLRLDNANALPTSPSPHSSRSNRRRQPDF
jgi:hypothetical protein